MNRYSIWIVSPPNYPHSQCFDEIAIGFNAAFRALGLKADIVRDPSRLGDITIVLGTNLLPGITVPTDYRLILFNLEQITPQSPWLTAEYLSLLGRYPVWDYSERNISELARVGIQAKFCGIGYMPELGRIASAPEDIDVLFVGSLNERRVAVLKQIAAQGGKVEAKFNVMAVHETASSLAARSSLICTSTNRACSRSCAFRICSPTRNASSLKSARTGHSSSNSYPE